jgi:hypothetical protein
MLLEMLICIGPAAHSLFCGSGSGTPPQPSGKLSCARVDAALSPDELVQRLYAELLRATNIGTVAAPSHVLCFRPPASATPSAPAF